MYAIRSYYEWYRSGGAAASQTVTLNVAAGATLEWLPQESIVFDGALARIHTRCPGPSGTSTASARGICSPETTRNNFV